MTTLNEQAHALADVLESRAGSFRVQLQHVAGARVLDCGVQATGGLQAGLMLARICLADRAEVSLVPGPAVQVSSDDPVLGGVRHYPQLCHRRHSGCPMWPL